MSHDLGQGHLMRARAIGGELAARSVEHTFVTPETMRGTALVAGLEEARVRCFDTGRDESAWVGKLPEATHVVVDFCHSEQRDAEARIASMTATRDLSIAVIDSMPPHEFAGSVDVPVDLLITPYANADRLRRRPMCRRWVHGGEYAVLAADYAIRHRALEGRPLIRGEGILLCAGGSDPTGLSRSVLGRLTAKLSLDVPVRVIVGALFDDQLVADLEALADSRVTLIRNKVGLTDELADCAMLIGQAGLIRYEAACLGKPVLLIHEGPAYRDYLHAFEVSGLGKVFRFDDESDRDRFDDHVERLGDPDLRWELTAPNVTGFRAIDGNGAARTVDALLGECV